MSDGTYTSRRSYSRWEKFHDLLAKTADPDPAIRRDACVILEHYDN